MDIQGRPRAVPLARETGYGPLDLSLRCRLRVLRPRGLHLRALRQISCHNLFDSAAQAC